MKLKNISIFSLVLGAFGLLFFSVAILGFLMSFAAIVLGAFSANTHNGKTGLLLGCLGIAAYFVQLIFLI